MKQRSVPYSDTFCVPKTLPRHCCSQSRGKKSAQYCIAMKKKPCVIIRTRLLFSSLCCHLSLPVLQGADPLLERKMYIPEFSLCLEISCLSHSLSHKHHCHAGEGSKIYALENTSSTSCCLLRLRLCELDLISRAARHYSRTKNNP